MIERVAEAPRFPYSERSSANAHELVAQLLAPPEIMLEAEELAEVRQFATGLFDGHISDELTCESEHTLKEVYKNSAIAPEQAFYLDYFATPSGQEDLQLLQLTPDITRDALPEMLLNVDYITSVVDDTTRKKIATRSLDWHKDQLADRLEYPSDQDWWEPVEPLVCNYEPDKLLVKLEDLQAYRQFYRDVYQAIKGEPRTDVQEARLVVLQCYVGRINNMMADLYPHAVNLAKQLDEGPAIIATYDWGDRLAATAPVVAGAFDKEGDDRASHLDEWAGSFSRRLEFVRNGVAIADGSITPVSAELTQFADSLPQVEAVAGEATLPAEVITLMDATTWSADEMKQLNEGVLAGQDLLSAYQTTWQEADKRDGYAPDGKWQVIVTPKKKSFLISGDKRVMWVPEKFERTLTQESPAGALPVSAHEQTHITQTEYDEVLAEQIPLAAIKGRRYVTMREMGGIYQERAFHSLLGRTRAANAHYLRALQTKLAGGTFMQAARAMHASLLAGGSFSGNAAAARENAIDRTMRLYRKGGHESQPLDYIEQELIMDALAPLTDEQRRAVVVAGGSFSLADTAALHRVGLLNLPEQTSADPTAAVMEVFARDFLPQLQAAAA